MRVHVAEPTASTTAQPRGRAGQPAAWSAVWPAPPFHSHDFSGMRVFPEMRGRADNGGEGEPETAVAESAPAAETPLLDAGQVERAIRYNRASYEEGSIRLLQERLGLEQTGTVDEELVQAIARFQDRNSHEKVDGKAGPITFDEIVAEMAAEGVAPGTCLTLFQLIGPEPLTFFRHAADPTKGTIGSRFYIRARFDSRCDCSQFEYRQYIQGNVELHDVHGGVFPANHFFRITGGLPSTWTEDENTDIAAGTAGRHYGHRGFSGNPVYDQYLPQRRTGCEFRSEDFPELGPIPAAPGDSGDRWEWLMRFRGVIWRRGHGLAAEKYWVIRGPVIVP